MIEKRKLQSLKYDLQTAELRLEKTREAYLKATGWSNFGSSPEGSWCKGEVTALSISDAVDVQWLADIDQGNETEE